jgi:2-desacetyl-2-hydroxyethyl bacteriochlorophyllide A dehydrogenase
MSLTTIRRAVVVHGVNDVRVDELPVPPPGPEDVRLKVKYSGISVGTERWLVTGQRPDAPFPIITGYQNCGIVEEVGEKVKNVQVGDRVSIGTTKVLPPINPGWGGHVSMAVAHAGAAVPIPDGVAWEEAALERLAAVGLHGARLANIRPGENVVIIGQGMIGHLLGQIARAWDAFVIASEKLPTRLELARQYSADVVVDANSGDLAAAVREHCPNGADVVVEAVGNAQNIPLCLDLVRERGRILLQGWYPGEVSFNFHRAHAKRVTVHFPCYLEGEEVILSMLERQRLHIRPLITHILPASLAPEAFRMIVDEPGKVMGMLLDWEET